MVALHGGAELLNDADRFMPNGQAASHRIFPLENMHVCPANCRRGDAYQSVQGTHVGDWLLIQDYSPRLHKDGCLHFFHGSVASRMIRRAKIPTEDGRATAKFHYDFSGC
jgi:hypothetical protein